MVRRVGHEHEVREPFAERDPTQARKIDFAVHVAVDDQERVGAEQAARQRHTARGLERLGLA